ncbi:MAG: protein-L-isoaspartate O-methyltransferase [Thiotrichales bacterium]|jgi:protein-L-isoaspartate(D-aspartate) O-methyltransferase|nr:protein-L-isoaspartate O-methyltransferase [Thiotrichales bacterium]MBT3614255.1 protein-L-isoaspartate O-methyltransferase [Thiotrichales bacterium]MBT3752270.1 protein-L-isoaspartate O-methyltransferase [Thiotrichales bacterium]MBT3837178.1 protein-L-isoaspartate O-methyltransferase [Thiotrichales bacterium]MBT4152818.1 protein-L-isoaspartate O-methyltransferase [Thiotrichales bacterium]
MNLSQARTNMIEQQIRPWDISDLRLLDILENTPRHNFVAESQQRIAYADTALPIGEGERMMHPILEARILQQLNIEKHETILEIGSGSGYFTALLCKLGGSVRSIELHKSLMDQAKNNLIKARIGNSILESGDVLSKSWRPSSQYNVIILGGAVKEVPKKIVDAVSSGGRLFAIIEKDGVKCAQLMSRNDDKTWTTQKLFETDIDMLRGSKQGSSFSF